MLVRDAISFVFLIPLCGSERATQGCARRTGTGTKCRGDERTRPFALDNCLRGLAVRDAVGASEGTTRVTGEN